MSDENRGVRVDAKNRSRSTVGRIQNRSHFVGWENVVLLDAVGAFREIIPPTVELL